MEEMALSMDVLPACNVSSFRYFEEHERHMTRTCSHDVLVMVFGGVLRFHEDGVPMEVHEGEFYIQRRGRLHEGIRESDMPRYYYIHFRGSYCCGKSTLPLRGKANFEELFPLFRKMDTLRMSGATHVEINAVFFQILSVLKEGCTRAGKSDVVHKVMSLVAQNIQHRYSLEEMATACGYSKNHVIKVFRSEMGKTPHAYITETKINLAKQQLLNSDSSLTQISIECGFGDYINFYKAFTCVEGCSPREWRERRLEEESTKNTY